MENADPDRLRQRIVLRKDDEAEQHTGALKAQRHEKDGLDQAHNALKAIDIESFFDQKARFDAHPPAGDQDKADADRGDAQAANLDETGDYGLAKESEMVSCVDGDEAGHAHRAGRSE